VVLWVLPRGTKPRLQGATDATGWQPMPPARKASAPSATAPPPATMMRPVLPPAGTGDGVTLAPPDGKPSQRREQEQRQAKGRVEARHEGPRALNEVTNRHRQGCLHSMGRAPVALGRACRF
jgi:hypothetical protein